MKFEESNANEIDNKVMIQDEEYEKCNEVKKSLQTKISLITKIFVLIAVLSTVLFVKFNFGFHTNQTKIFKFVILQLF